MVGAALRCPTAAATAVKPLAETTRRSAGAAFALLVGPAVGVLAPKGTVVVLAVAALLTVADAGVRGELARSLAATWRRPSSGTLLIVAGFLWLAVSAALAGSPAGGLRIVGQLAGLALLAVLVRPAFMASGDRLVRAALLGLALGALLLAEEGVTGNFLRGLVDDPPPDGWQLNQVNLGATNLVVFACACAALIAGHRGRVAAAGVLAAAAATTFAFDSLAASLAGCAALAVYGAATRWPRAVRAVLRWGAIAAVVAMPLAVRGLDRLPPSATDALPASALHRVLIWNFTVDRMAERPVLGWGLDSARHLGRGRTVDIRGKTVDALPLHPHNGVLQVWVETGLPGIALLLCGILWLTRRPGNPEAEPAKLALAAAAAAIGLTAYGLWQMHWLASLIVAAFGVAAARGENGRSGSGAGDTSCD